MKPVLPNTTSSAAVLVKNLVCLAEDQESVDALFSDPTICKALSDPAIANLIITLHITDQKLYNNFDLMMKA